MALFFLLALISYINADEIQRIPITADMVNSTTWFMDPNQIVGGTVVGSATDYPYMAAYMSGTRQFCGCSIIASRWCLTAAHCVSSANPTNEQISVGSLTHSNGLKSRVVRTIRHPQYNPSTIDYDVAVLELATELQFSATVQPIKLASAGTFDGVNSYITGWGATSEGGPTTGTLREVTIPIISNTQCSQYYDGITARMLCAYVNGGGKDSCQGDSGGPASIISGDFELVGIVSWGIGCARPNYPGVYTRVSSVYSWICSNTNGDVC